MYHLCNETDTSSTFCIVTVKTVDLCESSVPFAYMTQARRRIKLASTAIQGCCKKYTFPLASGWNLLDTASQYQDTIIIFNPSEEHASNSSNKGDA